MNALWQKTFFTVGVLIAVFGIRLVFLVVIAAPVPSSAPSRRSSSVNDKYQQLVTDAHPAIAAFGGVFLLMIFLDFVLGTVTSCGWAG